MANGQPDNCVAEELEVNFPLSYVDPPGGV